MIADQKNKFSPRRRGEHRGFLKSQVERETLSQSLPTDQSAAVAFAVSPASAGLRFTRYSSTNTITSAAVGTETSAPTTPASAPPMESAMITVRGERFRVCFMMRGERK